MTAPEESRIILKQSREGNPTAANRLSTLVEEVLLSIAAHRREKTSTPKQSVSQLVDEAFHRLFGDQLATQAPDHCRHFFVYLSEQMLALLIDRASMDGPDPDAAGSHRQKYLTELEQLSEALEHFNSFAPEDACMFQLHYFLGCDFEEIAALWVTDQESISTSFHRARTWLRQRMKEQSHDT